MRRKVCLYVLVAIAGLLSVIVAEEAYLFVFAHFSSYGKVYNRELLHRIRETIRVVKAPVSEEDWVRELRGVEAGCLTREEVRALPVGRGDYEWLSDDGSYVALDWRFYEIEPILDYCGIMKIGSLDGRIRRVWVEYTLGEEE